MDQGGPEAAHVTRPKAPTPLQAGLVQGGLGGPEDELLDAGQEEVFSRTEVESGRIEHKSDAGGGRSPSCREQTAKPPVGWGKETPMTDTNRPIPDTDPADTGEADRSAGVNRPDQTHSGAPGKTPADPATGGEGAAGAGGSGGFGT